MTANQLRLLIDFHTGFHYELERSDYPKTVDADIDYLLRKDLIYYNYKACGYETNAKGAALVVAACRLKVIEKPIWDVELPTTKYSGE